MHRRSSSVKDLVKAYEHRVDQERVEADAMSPKQKVYTGSPSICLFCVCFACFWWVFRLCIFILFWSRRLLRNMYQLRVEATVCAGAHWGVVGPEAFAHVFVRV